MYKKIGFEKKGGWRGDPPILATHRGCRMAGGLGGWVAGGLAGWLGWLAGWLALPPNLKTA